MDITKHRMHSYKTKGEVNDRPTDYNKIERTKGKIREVVSHWIVSG